MRDGAWGYSNSTSVREEYRYGNDEK